ncbi:MAG TPA: hypothetical protein VHI99_20315 [Vicinamibacterales bacterium]|nr:hypothetical protein [Vicinamibacterales bacterium]
MRKKYLLSVCPCCLFGTALLVGTLVQSAAPAPQIYKGLEVTVAGVTHATTVGLSDCPPGANTQRGVIKPGDTTVEFATVKVDFKVLPGFKQGMLPKPTLVDDGGKVYNTAQSFGEIESLSTFSCSFSFRVPKGAKVTKFVIDTASFDLASLTVKPSG